MGEYCDICLNQKTFLRFGWHNKDDMFFLCLDCFEYVSKILKVDDIVERVILGTNYLYNNNLLKNNEENQE